MTENRFRGNDSSEHRAVFTTARLGAWDVRVFPATETDPTFAEVIVPAASREEPYAVIVQENTITCDCLGFTYREWCRHAQEIREFLSREKK